MLRIMPFCCTFVTLRAARDRVASWGTTHPTDPFLILLSEEIMHYKAFNAKTLYIFYLEEGSFFAHCELHCACTPAPYDIVKLLSF